VRWLVGVEIASVAAFVALAAAALHQAPPAVVPLDVAALAAGPAEETWTGLFMGETHVGYAVSRRAPAAGGGSVYTQRSTFSIKAMGAVQQVTTAGTALVDSEDRLVAFDFLLSSPVVLTGRGEVRLGHVHVELSQGGTTSELDVPMQEPPTLGLTLPRAIASRTLAQGDRFELPYFDPVTMSQAPMTVEVDRPELLPNGETGWWLTTSMGSIETRRLVDAGGESLREESAMGLSARRMTEAEATALDGQEPPDLVSLASVPAPGIERLDTRRALSVRVRGIDPGRVPAEPPLQRVDGDVVMVNIPLLAELPSLPVRGTGDTEATPSLPATHPEIVAKARALTRDATDRLDAARRIHEFVFGYLAKVPTLGVPNGLQALRGGKGDCNEHTALYVSLARAVGIPARIAAGLVHSERLGPAFYYHAWPEVRLGGPTEWIPVDPTLGQFPADATHLKLVTGDLDRQVEIMGVLGRVALEVLPPATLGGAP
jgi:hypothetical protein